jgi:hypothetical protein
MFLPYLCKNLKLKFYENLLFSSLLLISCKGDPIYGYPNNCYFILNISPTPTAPQSCEILSFQIKFYDTTTGGLALSYLFNANEPSAPLLSLEGGKDYDVELEWYDADCGSPIDLVLTAINPSDNSVVADWSGRLDSRPFPPIYLGRYNSSCQNPSN